MHFNGLKIVGFKSFADPVDFAIHEGLTGIVGPNGCGKSNILESLRWVMGATSARAMRGGEMDDLIFSGSANRPARENAEVALILDNSARTAPAELNDSDELEVRRRLRRGAGSTYKINGRTVRAKDVQLLFADASTGANSPALVRQGQISELIASKPQNRRRILEEAAGIAGLNQRRHEAELKLRAASEGLSRLDEIIGEVEKQLNSLKRQASRAKKYRALQDEIEFLEIFIAISKWQKAHDEHQNAIEAFEHTSQNVELSSQAEAEASRIELEKRDAIPPLRETEANIAGQLGAAKLDIARLEGERTAALNTVSRLEQDITRIVDDQSREHSLREEADQALTRAQKVLEEIPTDTAQAYRHERERLSDDIDLIQVALKTAEEEYEDLSRQFATAKANEEATRRDMERAMRTRDSLLAEKSAVETSVRNIGNQAELEASLSTAQTMFETSQSAAQSIEAELLSSEQSLKSQAETEEKLRTQLLEAEKAFKTLEAEHVGIQRLIPSSKDDHRPVLDDTHPAAGLEKALAAALGDNLNASTNTSANQYWSGNTSSQRLPLPEGATPLDLQVDAPTALAFRLSQCGLVDVKDGPRLQTSLSQGQCLVSVEGDLWRWDGFIRTAKAPSSASQQLELRTRLKELSDKKTKQQKLVKKCEKKLDEHRISYASAKDAFKTLQTDAMSARQTVSQNKEAVLIAEQALERFVLRTSMISDNLARISDALALAESEIQTAEKQQSALTSLPPKETLEKAKDAVQQLRLKERDLHKALSELESEHNRSDGRKRALEREIKDWSRRSQNADTRLSELQSLRTGLRHQLKDAETRPALLETQLSELAENLQSLDSQRQHAADLLSLAEADLREVESAARAARDAAARYRESLARSESALEAAKRREDDSVDHIRSRFDASPADLSTKLEHLLSEESTFEQPDDLTSAEKQLTLLQRERDNLGGVNLEAESQILETAERMEAQLRERDDLDQAIAKLQEGVHALNAQGREKLLDAFEKVAAHFKILFETLFEGGDAQLKLTESDDPLQAGLEIFACPPGKRLSALSLMSGGEQALTATALIFAVFLSQPSPLCVLDEVDAPLDDANVDRFCKMLDAMRSKTDTRFVVITHNPVTMSRMDRLFGVTMQERGVSRLVSVDLQSAEQLVAAE